MSDNGLIKLEMPENILTDPLKAGLSLLSGRISISHDSPQNTAKKMEDGELDIALVSGSAIFQFCQFPILQKVAVTLPGKSGVFRLCAKMIPDQIQKVLIDERVALDVDFLNLLIPRLLMVHPELFMSSEKITADFDFAGSEFDAFILMDEDALGCKYNFMMSWDLDEAWRNYTQMPFIKYIFVTNPEFYIPDLEETFLKICFNVKKNFTRDAHIYSRKYNVYEMTLNHLYKNSLSYFLDTRGAASIKTLNREMAASGIIKGQVPIKFYNTK